MRSKSNQSKPKPRLLAKLIELLLSRFGYYRWEFFNDLVMKRKGLLMDASDNGVKLYYYKGNGKFVRFGNWKSYKKDW